MLNFLKSYCDYVYIPETVIKELNFQKDRGTEAKRKLASLCLNKITELKSDKFIIANDQACKEYIPTRQKFENNFYDEPFEIPVLVERDLNKG